MKWSKSLEPNKLIISIGHRSTYRHLILPLATQCRLPDRVLKKNFSKLRYTRIISYISYYKIILDLDLVISYTIVFVRVVRVWTREFILGCFCLCCYIAIGGVVVVGAAVVVLMRVLLRFPLLLLFTNLTSSMEIHKNTIGRGGGELFRKLPLKISFFLAFLGVVEFYLGPVWKVQVPKFTETL